MRQARAAQREWAARPLSARLRTIRALRHGLAARSAELARVVAGESGRPAAEILSAEIIPLAAACRFLERDAGEILAARRLGSEGQPVWLAGVEAEVRRDPLGLVLVIAPANNVLFLPGVQTVQALTAGNAVLWKPGQGGLPAAKVFASLAAQAGLAAGLLTVLPEDPEAGRQAIAAGVDKVLLTGSAATGREVLADLAHRLVPATVELSGCDAVFVLPGADLDRVARAVRFGLALNGGTTCIAPRRIFAPPALAPDLEKRLAALRVELPVTAAGIEEALAADTQCPYALGASIFGPEAEALALARRVRAGVVTINDLIVPTADPRLPFGGRGESGFGVTRGAEGLLDLTVPKVVAIRRGRRLPHLGEPHPGDAELFHAYLSLTHGGGLRDRLRGAMDLARAIIRRRGGGALPPERRKTDA